jgi:hypothetical protein
MQRKIFQTAPGVTVPLAHQMDEAYQVYEGHSLRANISFPHLEPILRAVVEMLAEPLFFVLHLPLHEREEQNMQGGPHDEVLYLDGQSKRQVLSILESYGQVLLCDGMSQFAVASHASQEEIFIQKYKLTDIFSNDPRRFVPLLQSFGLLETRGLVTVWDTFSDETPGECRRVAIEGLDAYMVADELKKQGMYRANIVEG